MSKLSRTYSANRIIDANINRSKEGLRVCEEIARFLLNNRLLTEKFKRIRHDIDAVVKALTSNSKLLKERESTRDIGRDIYINELKRNNFQDIFFANIQRVKESIRVLEEFSKLINKNCAVRFKKLRYKVYQLEKEAGRKI